MSAPDRLLKIPTSRIDREDECSACGRRLRERAHCWAHADGMQFCTRKCAAAHAAYREEIREP